MTSPKDLVVQNNSVIKSFAILAFLADAQTPKELGVISIELGMNKSTLYRFLTTLVQLGYVTQDPETGKYALGARVVWLASRFLESLDIRPLARPLLQQLVDTTAETVHLAILDKYEVVYIDKLDGHRAVRMISSVGNRMPAHCTGLGKALLASLSEKDWHFYVENIGLKGYTPNTIRDPDTFYREMRTIRQRGYAVDNSENEEGIRCIAVPITDHLGKTVAAISISGWSLTMTPDRDAALAVLARQTAQTISEQLGAMRRS